MKLAQELVLFLDKINLRYQVLTGLQLTFLLHKN